MDEDQKQAASDFLLRQWREGGHIEALPRELQPATRAEGYAIQALLEEQGAGPLAGWKIAATSKAGQNHINVGAPLAGRLLGERIVAEGKPVSLGANKMLVAEIEFVFRMNRTLEPRAKAHGEDGAYGEDEVLAAVGALHLGMEIPDSRFLRFETAGEAQLIADNACADQFVLGPEVTVPWRESDLAAQAVQGISSRGFSHQGQGANVLGGPLVALTWLANELSQHGVALRENQIVTTGTACVPLPVEPGDTVTGDYGELGRMTVAFTA